MHAVSEKNCRTTIVIFLSIALSACILCYAGLTHVAHADGGAPNLAYVSGVSTGVSVIDVGEGKVTKTLAIAGDPHAILLSQDGRFLYVTQPGQERVSVILRLPARIVCNADIAA